VQSSTGFGGVAERAVDGDAGGLWASGSVTHTLLETEPWWEVDLGASAAIDTLEVWNRADCCGWRLADFYVLVSDAPFASPDLDVVRNQAGVWSTHVPGVGGRPTVVTAQRNGRYVRVQLAGADYLSLAEVRLWQAPPAEGPAALEVEVLASYPHDAAAITQGLLLHGGWLYESTGGYGTSTLREVDLVTGTVVRQLDLSPAVWAEGLARIGGDLVQLTWQEETAFVYDLATFAETGQHGYATEGWGLCFDGQRLVMSDGTSALTFRDSQSFAELGRVTVTLDGQPLAGLNELECVGGDVYANVFLTDTIVRIDAANGAVSAVIDAGGLLTPAERQNADVLNGIAHDPSDGTFLLTGKRWPKLFRVRFVAASGT
jgi:glutaminyl-peptide cyclotransferase